MEKTGVSSANVLHIDAIPSSRSLLEIGNKIGLNTDPCDMLARLLCHGEVWPIKTKCFVGNLLCSFVIVFEDYHVHHKFVM